MRYQISGKQIDVGEALQSHVKDELAVVMGAARSGLAAARRVFEARAA